LTTFIEFSKINDAIDFWWAFECLKMLTWMKAIKREALLYYCTNSAFNWNSSPKDYLILAIY